VDADKAQITEVLIATPPESTRRTGRCPQLLEREIDSTTASSNVHRPRRLHRLFAQVHSPMAHLPAVEHRHLSDGDTATARTYVHAVLMVTPDDDAMWVDVAGHYDDELVRGAHGWRIRRRVTCTPRTLTGGGVA
jgi:hypothetical protein